MKFSFVIPIRNGAKTIISLLQSIYEQSSEKGLNFEVIVVDNASTDDAPNLIRARFPDVVLLSCPKIGRSYARNLGLEKACGEYVIFTDADVILDKQWFSSVINTLKFFPYDVLSGTIKPTGSSGMLQELRILKALANTQSTYNTLEVSRSRLPSLNTATVIIKNNFLKSKQICFDTSLKRCEDTDLTYQIFAAGGWFGIARDAISYVSYEEGLGTYLLRSIRIGYYNYILRLKWFGSKRIPLGWIKGLSIKQFSPSFSVKALFFVNNFFQMIGESFAFISCIRNTPEKILWHKKQNISSQNLQFLKCQLKGKCFALRPQFTFIDLTYQGIVLDIPRLRFFCIEGDLWKSFKSCFMDAEEDCDTKEQLIEYLKKRNAIVLLAD